ncbi:MAG: coiled-coil domain-containing protein, partial [Varibaculum timonense]
MADIEAQLVKLSAYTQDVRDQAEDAEAGYNDAISNLVVAKETADKTAKDSQEAKGKVEEARKALGGLARTVYTTQGSLSSLTPYLHADGLQTVEMRKVSVELFGSKADSQMQTFDSIAKVAGVLEARAKAAQNEKEEAARDLKTQKEAADKLKADTEQKLASLGTQREELVKKLAAARGVTEQAEKERQEQIEAERKAREEAAKQAALKAAEEQAKREAAEAARKAAEKKAREEEAAKRAESNRKSKDSKASSSQRKNKSNTASSSDSKANNTSEKTSSASQHGSR